MRNKKNCLKVKLLHELRVLSYRCIGVFYEKGKFVIAKMNVNTYEILETLERFDSLEKAKEMCDCYRRDFILNRVREYKCGTSKRYY